MPTITRTPSPIPSPIPTQMPNPSSIPMAPINSGMSNTQPTMPMPPMQERPLPPKVNPKVKNQEDNEEEYNSSISTYYSNNNAKYDMQNSTSYYYDV
jgi:hypothetical protein